MLLVACYKQHGTIHDATLLKATVACYKVTSCMVAFSLVPLEWQFPVTPCRTPYKWI